MLKKFFRPVEAPPAPPMPDLAGLLESLYFQKVAQQQLHSDPAQLAILTRLQPILQQLVTNSHQARSPKVRSCPSVYLYGEVGCGKSMLMQLFYEACPLPKKRRVHFNAFMREVHSFVHTWRLQNRSDALTALAQELRAAADLLCFDEFHVSDIADAMILGRLFNKLFELGLVVFITSNRPPDELYQGGLQREQFLFFVDELLKNTQVLAMVASQDYRLIQANTGETRYFCPALATPPQPEAAQAARAFLRQTLQRLTAGALLAPHSLSLMGRNLNFGKTHQDILYTTFTELCGQPLSAADYLAVAEQFNIVILAGIPRLSPSQRNEAKRLMMFIDVWYEHGGQLICTAEAPPALLYLDGDGAFEFKRTASRLVEMQSERYLRQADMLRQQRLAIGQHNH